MQNASSTAWWRLLLLMIAISSQSPVPPGPTVNELRWLIARSRAPRLRSMREFAESEIILPPNGPFPNLRFRVDRQPYTGLWFDAVDSGHWNRFAAHGPTQSGKTLACNIIPLLYHLFEVKETVIFGLPNMDMAGDKWRADILPAILQSRYKDLLPTRGGGSRGGRVESITFRHGPTLKFMSGGGGDKSRAGFTARVVLITEVDGMDAPAGGSREADKITQMEARTRAYGENKRIYLECTVSVEEGRINQEHKRGTASKIVLPCPHCGAWISPEREHLAGWQDADDAIEAKRLAYWFCSECGEAIADADRQTANGKARLLHRGQEIDASGEIRGPMPPTDTLGFRWSAFENLFTNATELGSEEWRGSRAANEENAEKEACQFTWAIPYQSPNYDMTPITAEGIRTRTLRIPKGQVPADAEVLTVAVDLGKFLAHWMAIAWRPGATGHICDYGKFEISSDQFGVERAIMLALKEFRELCLAGWTQRGASDAMVPREVWIDARYKGKVVKAFAREATQADRTRRFRPAYGHGVGQERRLTYRRPKKKTKEVLFIGEGYHIALDTPAGVHVVEVDANDWKSWGRERLAVPLTDVDGRETPGAMTLFHAMPKEHLALSKHLTAEHPEKVFVPGKGEKTQWVVDSRTNHWLDTFYNACAAGHFCGARLLPEAPPAPPSTAPRAKPLTTPDGRPFLLTER